MFRLLTSRRPTTEEADTILKLYEAQLAHLSDAPDEAAKYLAVGDTQPKTDNSAKLAAWASVANTLFAFDECMMKR